MKRLVDLLTAILTDVGIMCNTSIERDLEYIRSRLEHEGESFLTITLPSFAKAFEQCLELGRYDQHLFRPFHKVKTSGRIPAFLQGIVSLVFDGEGVLREDASVEAIDGIRQLCLVFNKLKQECTDARKRKAIKAYLLCEEDHNQGKYQAFRSASRGASDEEVDEGSCDVPKNDTLHYPVNFNFKRLRQAHFSELSRMLFGRVFNDVAENLHASGLKPKHGPGAVVEKLRGNSKYNSHRWTRRLERTMPAADYLFSNHWTFLADRHDLELLKKGEEPPVKVIFVPKTAKTPRVIAIEPTHMQYAQQALALALVSGIESSPLLRKRVNFRDASINGNAARKASIDRKYCTLDLSEASDRVHAGLVTTLFGSNPELRSAIFNCRSSRAKLPSGEIIPIKKFASMGSALCFPVESMVFFVLCCMAGLQATWPKQSVKHFEKLRLSSYARFGKKPPKYEYCFAPATEDLQRVYATHFSYASVLQIAKRVRVFGDDLIVPVEWRGALEELLEDVGLKVNTSKSFSLGYFRESCGTDAFKGHLVTPVYVRSKPPTKRSQHKEVISYVESSNLFYKKGYWKTAEHMRLQLSRLKLDLPHVLETSSMLGYFSYLGTYSIGKWSKRYSNYLTRGLVTSVQKYSDELYGNARLLKFFLTRGDDEIPTEQESFVKSTLRGSVVTKIRWATPY